MKKDRRNQSLSLSHTPGTGLKRLALSVAMAFTGLLGLGEALNSTAADLPDVGDAKGSSISTSGPNMTITTPAGQQRSAIDWKSFSIGEGNKVTFVQPNGKAITLNRVTGTDVSRILGQLQANGHIILANPNGIHIGPNAKINTAALTAVAGKFSDEQLNRFLQGNSVDPLSPDRVMAELTGKVKNEGEITAADKGLVVLLGAQVENNGKIVANKGTIMLASGPQATLDFTGDGLIGVVVDSNMVGSEPGKSYSVTNAGTLVAQDGTVIMSAKKALDALESVVSVGGNVVADSVSTDKGGNIIISGADRSTVTGTLSAKGADGGNITVLGDKVELAGSAKLDASGTQGKGGKILVGGSFQGKGPEKAARSTSVAKGAQLVADGKKDGGQAVVWSDGDTRFAGSASAKGGEKGGVVETSGKRLNVTADARVDASGGKQAGTWLLDPDTVDVIDTTGNASVDGTGAVTGNPADVTWTVSNQAIVAGLATNDVQILANNRININAPIIATNIGENGGVKNTLALIANGPVPAISGYDGTDKRSDAGSVYINAPILLKDGNLFISATGDIHLVDNAAPGDTGDAAWKKRAIIDLGEGIAWLKTTAGGTVLQDANTALIADQVAVWGASVKLESELNSTRVLAGRAVNGVFKFVQTNATGSVDQTTVVNSPYTNETLGGIQAYQIRYLGSQDLVADTKANPATSPYREYALGINGQEFDAVVFESTRFVRPDGVDDNGQTIWTPISDAEMLNYLDSSDYLVSGLKFTDVNGVEWTLTPDKSNASLTKVTRKDINGQTTSDDLPVGFRLSVNGGVLAVSDVGLKSDGTPEYVNAGWGVSGWNIPGAANPVEIQHDSQRNQTQQLVFALGDGTTAMQATLGWLLNDQSSWIKTKDGKAAATDLHEQSRVHYYDTQTSSDWKSVDSRKATLAVAVDDKSRTYGDANPTLTQQQNLNADAQAVREVDQFVDRELGRTGVSTGTPVTAATQNSNVGQYGITSSVSGDSFAQKRYEMTSVNGTLTITPAQLTVRADDKTKVYGDADPALTHGGVQGLKNGDTADQVLNDGNLGREAGENVRPQGYQINKGTVGLNDSDIAKNYTLVFQNGTLTITPADVTVTIDDKTKPHGTPDPELTHTVDGLKNGDKLDGNITRNPGEDVGGYGIHEGSPFNNPNYRVTVRNGTLTITGPVRIPDQPAPPQPGQPAPPAPPAPGEPTAASAPITAQAPGTERCNAMESPSAVIGGYTVTPAVTRTYDVQLICKPRAYEDKYETLPEIGDILTYVNNMAKEGKFQIPDWNRTVIPRDLKQDLKNEKGGAK
ncbi:Heme/hemopexin-binding protein precursor [compost metagenome]